MSRWIDDKIVSSSYKHTRDHRVRYCVYYDERKLTTRRVYIPKDPEKEFGAKFKGGVCFAQLLPTISRQKVKPNRLYAIIEDDAENILLSLSEKKTWIRMAKQNKLLPPYFSLSAAKNGIFVLDTSEISPSLLYCYLATFRFIREDPGFVRAMIYLVKELEIDFYAAFVLATKICLSHSGHSITYDVRQYMSAKQDPEKVTLKLKDIIGLKRFVNDPKRYDTRSLTKAMKGDWGSDYRCNTKIEQAAGAITIKCKAELFKTPSFKKVLEASSDEDVIEYCEKATKEVDSNG